MVISMRASRSMPSGAISRRALGASSMSSSGTRTSVPAGSAGAVVVTSNSAGAAVRRRRRVGHGVLSQEGRVDGRGDARRPWRMGAARRAPSRRARAASGVGARTAERRRVAAVESRAGSSTMPLAVDAQRRSSARATAAGESRRARRCGSARSRNSAARRSSRGAERVRRRRRPRGSGRGTCGLLSSQRTRAAWRRECVGRSAAQRSAARRPTAARSAATVSAAIWSSASAGSVITTIRSASTDSGAQPIAMWMVGTPWLGEPADALDAGGRVVPAAVAEHVGEARAARVGHLEAVGGGDDRVAGERGAAAGADARARAAAARGRR